MVGNGGQSSRAVGGELHLRTAVWGQQAVLALSGLAAVPDRRLVDQRRRDSGQRRPDVFDAAVQQYGRRSTGAARGCGARGGSACGQSRAGAVVQPGGVCAASGFHDWGCVAHFIEPAQSRLAEFRYVAEQAIRAGRGPDAGGQCDGVRFHESRQLERSGQRDRVGGDAEPGCGQDHWFARRTCDSIGFEAELLRQAATVLVLGGTLIAAAPPKPTSHTIRVAVWADATDVAPLAANLAAKDLSATVAGTESRVVDVKGPGDDLMLVAVLDLAGDLSLAEPAKDALAADIEKLPRRNAVAVMRAQDGAKVLADPGTDRAAAVSAVRDLPVSGKAGLLDRSEEHTSEIQSLTLHDSLPFCQAREGGRQGAGGSGHGPGRRRVRGARFAGERQGGTAGYRGNGDAAGGFDSGESERARGSALCDGQRPGELSRGLYQSGDQFQRHSRFEPEVSRSVDSGQDLEGGGGVGPAPGAAVRGAPAVSQRPVGRSVPERIAAACGGHRRERDFLPVERRDRGCDPPGAGPDHVIVQRGGGAAGAALQGFRSAAGRRRQVQPDLSHTLRAEREIIRWQ